MSPISVEEKRAVICFGDQPSRSAPSRP